MPVAPVRIDERVCGQLLAEALRAGEQECCGLLLGSAANQIEDMAVCRNIAAEPERHFEIPPQDIIAAEKEMRRGGRLLLGYYHSHPAGGSVPSPTDARRSACDGRLWAIIAGNIMRLWRNEAGGTVHGAFTEISYSVAALASDET